MDYTVGMKRKRGIAQRMEAETARTTYKSMLAEFLLDQLAWGIFSTLQVEQLAKCAGHDLETAGVARSTFPDLDDLAKAGTYGKYANNVHRDIMASVRGRVEYQPYDCYLPFEKFGEQPAKINLPHETFAYLYNNRPEAFKKQVLPDTSQLHEFWKTMEDHPGISALVGEDLSKAVPLAMHGDEVPITGVGKIWCKSALTFQFFSVLAHAAATPTKELMFWVWAVFEKFLSPGEDGTVASFMNIMKWSYEALFKGEWPDHDWHGHKQLDLISFCFGWDLG